MKKVLIASDSIILVLCVGKHGAAPAQGTR